MEFLSKKDLNIVDNKKINIKDIYGIEIDNFRMMVNQQFNLARNITVVSGRNGTMKSTLMGLIAQPFRTDHINILGMRMETKFSEVFKLSSKTDLTTYLYHIKMIIDDNLSIKEPIPLYYDSTGNRHRLVPSGRNKGDGYFNLPSVYINLKRLYPLVDLEQLITQEINYEENEKAFIAKLYEQVLLKSEYAKFENYSVTGKVKKNPIGPKDSIYDVTSISSGEDNLGFFANVLISFMRVYRENKRKSIETLTGILSIDEFEASLHPISQLNLFNFLLAWSQKYNVKIVLNTHSLYLIDEALKMKDKIEHNHIKVNFITNRFSSEGKLSIVENPEYRLAKEELTLSPDKQTPTLTKVIVLCEDDVAKEYIKVIIGRKLVKYCEFQHQINSDQNGTGFKMLVNLAKNYPKLMIDSRILIVLDGDVQKSDLKFKNSNRCFITPTINNSMLPLEKELANYILNLQQEDDFFIHFRKTKEMFKQELSQCGIPLNSDNVARESIESYKKWFKRIGKQSFNVYRNYMIRSNKSVFKDFIEDFKRMVNYVLKENGFPEMME